MEKHNFLNYTLGKPNSNAENYFTLRLLSFNILAQNLLETHSYLYKNHDPAALSWMTRKPLVLQEIFEAEANVCIYTYQMYVFISSKLNYIKFETKNFCHSHIDYQLRSKFRICNFIINFLRKLCARLYFSQQLCYKS